MKILIIEDDQIIRHALNRAFLARGHEVLLAEDGKEGIETWKSQAPDLVLLDVVMPYINGVQILAMKKNLPQAKVVVMSAYTGDPQIWQTLKKRADMILSKPFENIFDIIEKIENLLKETDRSDF